MQTQETDIKKQIKVLSAQASGLYEISPELYVNEICRIHQEIMHLKSILTNIQ
jgi:cystathionine beta-lyase family protein involved in aluminum resistance